MDLVASVVAVVGLALLSLEGGWCLFTAQRPRSIGALDLLFAGIVAFVLLAVSSGLMVVATELGTIMVQGTVSRLLLRIALVVTAIVPGLWWHRVRSMHGWNSSLKVILVLGLVAGSWAAARVAAFNTDDPETLRVYRYDVWWPPMIVWVAVCVAGSLLDLGKAVVRRSIRAALAAALVASLASFALSFQDLPDGQSRPVWAFLERAGSAVALMLLGYALMTKRVKRRIWPWAVVWVAVLTAISAAYAMHTMPSGMRAIGSLCLLSAAVTAVIIFHRRYGAGAAFEAVPAQALTGAESGGTTEEEAMAEIRDRLRALKLARALAIATFFSLPVIAFLAVDLLSIGFMNRTLELSLLLAFWLFLGEQLAGGATVHWPRILRVRLSLHRERRRARSKKKPASRWVTAIKAVLVPILVLIFLTAASEVMDYRPLVIQSFQWTGSKDAKDATDDISKDVTDGLINALGRMREDLSTDLILALRQSSGEHPSAAGLHFLQAGAEAHTVEAAVAKSGDLKIANVNIPLGFFVSPIQTIVRSLLGVRIVTGTVTKAADGRYLIRADASDGQSWREPSDDQTQPMASTSATADDSPQIKCAKELMDPVDQVNVPSGITPAAFWNLVGGMVIDLESGFPLFLNAEQVRGLKGFQEQRHVDPVDLLVEKLAFDVASSDPSFIGAGMTKDWIAFGYFRTGVTQWQAAEARQDEQAREKAITCFRASLHRDRKFTMASYRLGLAMRREGQPGAAVAAFHGSTEANRGFAAGALEEAATLYDFNDYYPSAALPDRNWPDWSRRDQALRTWTGLIMHAPADMAVSERRSAYLGICQYELDRRDRDREHDGNYLAYFFCSRAAALFSQLTAADRQSPEARNVQAASLNRVGIALELHDGTRIVVKSQAGRQFGGEYMTGQLWMCGSGAVDREEIDERGSAARIYVFGSPSARAALEYYRKSLELVPDDRTVQCNAASIATYLAGNTKPMEALRKDSDAHAALGSELFNVGFDAAHEIGDDGVQSDGAKVRASGYYLRAHSAYEAAVDLDSTSLEAVTGTASLYWQLRLDHVLNRSSQTLGLSAGWRAEASARTAVKLARLRQRLDDELDASQALGEVLLGQGRFAEAIAQLDSTVGYAVRRKPSWQSLNEIRWDLAQAQVCAAADKATDDERRQFDQAERELSAIRRSEESAEHSQFTSVDGGLDTTVLQSHCQGLADQWFSEGDRFSLHEPSYSAGPSCRWASVLGRVENGSVAVPGAVFVLHVWGGGVDVRADLDNGAGAIVLDRNSEPAGGRYYSQLEERQRRAPVPWTHPLSRVQTFAVFGADGGECNRNQANLVFFAPPKQSSAAETRPRSSGGG